MTLKATWLLVAAALAATAISACGDDTPVDDGSSSGNVPTDDDDDNGTSSGSSSGQNGSPTTTSEETMTFQGRTRRYLLVKPRTYDSKKTYPLVLNLHGNPGRPEDEQAGVPFESVTKQDAIVAYPAAANGSDWDFSKPEDGNADMAWIGALIEEIATKVTIDPKNVLGFGYSGGAYFLSQFACRVGGVLKMVAILSGGAPDKRDGDATGEYDCVKCVEQIPTFIAHGELDDSEVSFEGGNYAQMCWGSTNGCSYNDFTDGTSPCKKANNCDQPMTWCPVPDQGHGPWQPSMQQAWDMFEALP